MDPNSGATSIAATADGKGTYHYAGDSCFFRVSSGQGEIWNFNGSLTLKAGGISSQTFSQPFSLQSPIAPDSVAVVTSDGRWISRISTVTGAALDNPISSDLVSDVRGFYASFTEKTIGSQGRMPAQAKLANVAVLSALGSDRIGSVYALVVTPSDAKGVLPVVKLDDSGVASVIARVQLPLNGTSGRPQAAMKIVALNSQLGIVPWGGSVAWYNLPSA